MLNAFLFHHPHHVVHQSIWKFEAIDLVNGFFDDGGIVEGVAGSSFVSVDQAADAQFNSSEIPHNNTQNIKRPSWGHDFMQRTIGSILPNGIAGLDDNRIPKNFLLPGRILLLNFNYTNVADFYLPNVERISVNHIHGELTKPESVIFGYGDEIDENYKKLSNKNDNEYLTNIKSIKYLESPNYRNLLDFIESDAYQIYIMGHSCGNSDRTLLNTLFEHKNCVSIKPFYFIRKDGTDNYMELVQIISRNFTDMKLMRDRVVNKTFCEAYSDAREKVF